MARQRAVLGQITDADWRLLRVFTAVAHCGGMTAAELELNISTSTISRHVKDLESRLGLVLCRRGRGGFALTPAGERILQETRQLLAATDRFRASVDELHQRLPFGQAHPLQQVVGAGVKSGLWVVGRVGRTQGAQHPHQGVVDFRCTVKAVHAHRGGPKAVQGVGLEHAGLS